SFASWALRFAASLDNVITVLSGMSNIEQMEDNLAVMSDFRPLAPAEYAVIEKVKETLNAVESVPCTNCAYCLKGCPQGIVIPEIFGLLNQYLMFDSLEPAKSFYGLYTRHGNTAGSCSECAQCESVCPQRIGIIQELKRAAAVFE
ncbi:MAG: 4Fe-4S dicluster domain-containing protein, partial [Gracilibacteraceae bacterium]|nr:4Fe-4S dicluster domain-containing protein [Gracilibacteraceae bacterium]